MAFRAVDDMPRRLREVGRFERFDNGVQAPQPPAVVVLVMALDELQREAAQRPGTAVDLLQLIAHDDTSKHKVELRPDGLRTLCGARIRHATLTGLDGAPSWRDKTRGSCQPPEKRLHLCGP